MSCGKRTFFGPKPESAAQKPKSETPISPKPKGSVSDVKALSSEESRFEQCPVCNKHVNKIWIGSHVEEHFESGTTSSVGGSVRNAGKAKEPILISGTPISSDSDVVAAQVDVDAVPAPPPLRKPQMDPMAPGVAPVFGGAAARSAKLQTPLAERVRPRTLDEVVGHTDVVGHGTLLRALLDSDRVRIAEGGALVPCFVADQIVQIPSMILWGPPGCGKTSLAKIICKHTRAAFKQLSAVSTGLFGSLTLRSSSDVNTGLQEIRDVLREARQQRQSTRRSCVLFIDEVHRFNKLQQDVFLPVCYSFFDVASCYR
jgi:putative ATPase